MVGILAKPDAKKGQTLKDDVKEKVQEIYESDKFTRLCPGKRILSQFISVV